MRFICLACDYDGTLAADGCVSDETISVLKQLKNSGRKLVLVSGRELDDLKRVFGELAIFDQAVLENGALIYYPATGQTKVLAPPPPPEFIDSLRSAGVAPLSQGASIIATWYPHETTALETIRRMGLDLQVIFNKGAVMILPSGVNKGTGLRIALEEMGISVHNAVGVGDAENDHAFLQVSGCSAAVANALPAVKERVDLVMDGAHGIGVQELVHLMLTGELTVRAGGLPRHQISLGLDAQGSELRIPCHGANLLFAGPSGNVKAAAAKVLNRLSQARYQFCLVDPAGNYDGLKDAIVIGGNKKPPELDELLSVLESPYRNATINFRGSDATSRTAFINTFFARVDEMYLRFGRPHWIVFDQAHQVMPRNSTRGGDGPSFSPQMILVTDDPGQVDRKVLGRVNVLIALGAKAAETIKNFADALGLTVPDLTSAQPVNADDGEGLAWVIGSAVTRLRPHDGEGEIPVNVSTSAVGNFP